MEGQFEILFHGKRVDNGQWVEGYYVKHDETTYALREDCEDYPQNIKHLILFDRMTDWGLPNLIMAIEVAPSTIGQYSGFRDKNKKRIFSGDVLSVKGYVYDPALKEKVPYEIRVVVRFERHNGFCVEPYNYDATDGTLLSFYDLYNGNVEIIGNIYDNPELVPGDAKQ